MTFMKRTARRDTLFGKYIRDGRALKKYSQRKLASIVCISHGNEARIEGGYSIPKNDDVIRRLAKALDISESELFEAAESDRMAREDIQNIYPASYSLFQSMLSVMSDDTQNNTFDFFERRICLFNEDEKKLSLNFVNYLLGKLDLYDIPANGLRPLSHYFSPWCSEIEQWDTANLQAEPKDMIKEKKAVDDSSPFTQIQLKFMKKVVESMIKERGQSNK